MNGSGKVSRLTPMRIGAALLVAGALSIGASACGSGSDDSKSAEGSTTVANHEAGAAPLDPVLVAQMRERTNQASMLLFQYREQLADFGFKLDIFGPIDESTKAKEVMGLLIKELGLLTESLDESRLENQQDLQQVAAELDRLSKATSDMTSKLPADFRLNAAERGVLEELNKKEQILLDNAAQDLKTLEAGQPNP